MELNKRNYNIVFMKKLLTKRKRYAKMVATSDNRDVCLDFCAKNGQDDGQRRLFKRVGLEVN